jgi:hypothetical protein
LLAFTGNFNRKTVKQAQIELRKQIFDQRGNSCTNWIITARELLAAATVLCRQREKAEPEVAGVSKAPMESLTFWVELMLCGFAIECLLKALWVKKGNQIAKDGEYIKVMKTENHDLVALCQKIGFPLNPKEKVILVKLSELARATGRYPIAMSHSKMHDETEQWSSEEDRINEELVLRLKKEIVDTKTNK